VSAAMREIRQSLIVSLWMVFLTFPLMVIRVNTIEEVVEWWWANMLWVRLGAFFLSFV